MIKSLKLKLYKTCYRIRYLLWGGPILEIDDKNRTMYLALLDRIFSFDENLNWDYCYNPIHQDVNIKNTYDNTPYQHYQYRIDDLPWVLNVIDLSDKYSHVSPALCVMDMINHLPKIVRDNLPDWFTEAIMIEELRA